MLISNMHVFPLVKASQYMDGYFMDQGGNVYSNKASRTGVLFLMGGSKTPSGRYYTLNRRAYRSDDLVAQAKRHPQFAQEVNPQAVEVAKVIMAQGGLPVTMQLGPNKSKTASKLIQTKGYVLATVGPTDKLVFGTDPVFQLDEKTAETEALRIATMKPGTRVVLLKAVKSVVVGGARWE